MTDENERHSVLIVGIDGIPGGPAAASTRLEQKFRLPRPVAEKLVSSIPAVVKKDVTMEDAQRYAAAIRSIGADARIVPYSANKKDKAAVTGILKPRRPRTGLSESRRGDVVPTSGGYISVNKKREAAGEPSPREQGTAAGGIVPAAAAAVSPEDSKDETRVEAASLETAKTIIGTAFDPSAFALPSTLNAEGSEDDAAPALLDPFEASGPAALSGNFIGTSTDEFGAADTAFVDSEVSEGNRPSLFDELMSMGDSGIGMSLDSGDFGLSESGEAEARKKEKVSPAPSRGEGGPKRETGDRTIVSSESGPAKVDQFGNLELGDDANASGLRLQLDTDKRHLTGSFAAISESGGFDTSNERSDEFDLPPAPPKAKGTVRLSALNDPLAEEIERTLRESQPIERPKMPMASGSAKYVTGGFSAAAERNRNSNSRFARVIGWMILLIILAGGAVAGFVFYERWAATLDAKSFAEAPNYFEHTTRLAASEDVPANFVRGCAQSDPAVPTFSCRYSQEFYESRFPEVDSDIQAAAASRCYGTLFDDGQSSAELLDCKVTVARPEGNVSARFYVAFQRECEVSLLMMESGDTTQCTFAEALEVLANDAAPPSGERVPVGVEYKRPFELDTDVGGLASREYLFTGAGRNAEYHYFSESVGLFVRAAELGGAASLRLTFADRGGNTAGHQAWPR